MRDSHTVSDTTATSAAQATDTTPDSAPAAPKVTPADLATAAQETAPDTDTTGQAPTVDSETGQTIEDLQKQIADLRKEAGKYRTRAKDAEKAGADALADYQRKAAKELGLITDDEPTPDDLIAAANEQAKKAQQELATYKREAAVTAAAAGKVTDPALLNALLTQDADFTALDPTADDYSAQVTAAVDRQIEAHPALRAHAAASGVDTSTTSTGTDRKITREDLAKMTPHEINAAVKAGKLNHLMNKEQ